MSNLAKPIMTKRASTEEHYAITLNSMNALVGQETNKTLCGQGLMCMWAHWIPIKNYQKKFQNVHIFNISI